MHQIETRTTNHAMTRLSLAGEALGRMNVNILFICYFLLLTSVVFSLASTFYKLSLVSALFILIVYHDAAYLLRNKLTVHVTDMIIMAAIAVIAGLPIALFMVALAYIGTMGGLPVMSEDIMMYVGGMTVFIAVMLIVLLAVGLVCEKRPDIHIPIGYALLVAILFFTVKVTWLYGELTTNHEDTLRMAMIISGLFYPVALAAFYILASSWSKRDHLLVLAIMFASFIVYFFYNREGYNPYQALKGNTATWTATVVLSAAIFDVLARKVFLRKYQNWILSPLCLPLEDSTQPGRD